jgi:HD-GYP domain-containing protein (c-di-GMP phosphodiesterase class II)
MLIENNILIYDFVRAISEAVDLISPVLNRHHKKVAYISEKIARELGLSDDEVHEIVLASMLHDIGAFSIEERIGALTFEASGEGLNRHADLGYELMKGFEPLAGAARLIKYHHFNFDESNRTIPIGSYIIHLADRASLLFDEHREVLGQIPWIHARISTRRNDFHPDALVAFEQLSKSEYFCIEAVSSLNSAYMFENTKLSRETVTNETLREFAKIVAQLIDFRCRFTATHSNGVAAVVKELSALAGLSAIDCEMMEIAGLLHDLGKLSVPKDILEKKGALSDFEHNVIRKHTYYTFIILKNIRGLEHIASWAAHHHERPDGNGYPFHIQGESFSQQSRIVAVADVVTALTEDRPYRMGMNRQKAEGVLSDMTKKLTLDADTVDLVTENYFYINDVRINAQREAQSEYDAFQDCVYLCAA